MDDERIVVEYLAWCVTGRGQSKAKDGDVIVRTRLPTSFG